MSQKTIVKPRTKVKTKVEKPPLWKVILLNDDFTPREFVVQVLKAVFRMNETHAYHVMMTAHQKGACVIAVYTKDVADTKAKEATDLGKAKGLSAVFHDGERRVGGAFFLPSPPRGKGTIDCGTPRHRPGGH